MKIETAPPLVSAQEMMCPCRSGSATLFDIGISLSIRINFVEGCKDAIANAHSNFPHMFNYRYQYFKSLHSPTPNKAVPVSVDILQD
jgi:hypothetical protein